MNKKTLALLLALCLTLSLLAACSGDGGSDNQPGSTPSGGNAGGSITVTFDLNYDGAPAATTQSVAEGDVATEPSKPSRTNYEFTGWYSSAAATSKFDFEDALYANVTVYAGWKQVSATVTFDDNYAGGGSSTATVTIGDSASQPSAPSRDGYLFTAWYSDTACTSPYDFSSAVNGDITVYAGWEESSGDTVRLTYYFNYDGAPGDGVATVETINKNSKTSGFKATRDGYSLAGWYVDAECTELFDFTKRITSNESLYARWLKVYTFEAEYVDLTGINGSGYSGGYGGTGLIEKDVLSLGASNGYYVTNMYMPNVCLTFKINSDADIADAVLVLRLGAEFFDMTITDEIFTIEVNGVKVSYKDIALTNVPSFESGQKLPFKNFELSKVALQAGENVITLTVSNDKKMNDSGTLYATAPMVDCLYLYADTGLDWAPKTENLDGR